MKIQFSGVALKHCLFANMNVHSYTQFTKYKKCQTRLKVKKEHNNAHRLCLSCTKCALCYFYRDLRNTSSAHHCKNALLRTRVHFNTKQKSLLDYREADLLAQSQKCKLCFAFCIVMLGSLYKLCLYKLCFAF